MKKEEFLKILQSKLDVLENSEIEDIIEEYKMHIEEKLKKGTKEEKVIKSFGNIDDLVKEILSAYKISDKYVKKEINNMSVIDNIKNDVVGFIKSVASSLSTCSIGEIIKVIISFIGIFVIVLLMRIPFALFSSLGTVIFLILPNSFEVLAISIWRALVEFSYVGLCIFIFYSTIKYLIINKNIKEVIENKNEKKTVSSDKKGSKNITIVNNEKEEKRKIFNFNQKELSKIFFLVIKIFLTFITIPFLFCTMGLTIAFGALVVLAFQGIYLVGLFILLIGLILASNSVLFMIYRLIWKGGFN